MTKSKTKVLLGWWAIPGSGITVMRMEAPYYDFVFLLGAPEILADYRTNLRTTHDSIPPERW